MPTQLLRTYQGEFLAMKEQRAGDKVNLIVILRADGLNYLKSALHKKKLSHSEIWRRLFIGEWKYERPQDKPELLNEKDYSELGLLTNSPVIAFGVNRYARDGIYGNKGEIFSADRVYWFPDYQIEDELQSLLKNHWIRFEPSDSNGTSLEVASKVILDGSGYSYHLRVPAGTPFVVFVKDKDGATIHEERIKSQFAEWTNYSYKENKDVENTESEETGTPG